MYVHVHVCISRSYLLDVRMQISIYHNGNLISSKETAEPFYILTYINTFSQDHKTIYYAKIKREEHPE